MILARCRRRAAIAGLFALSACSVVPPPPDAASISGRSPSGEVSITETVVAGMTAGSGSLYFQGRSYPFRMVGSVFGPGGAARIQASGQVYGLTAPSQLSGRYTQGTGPAGLDTSSRQDLWLGNGKGVIMHLRGSSEGAVLSLGRDEVLIEMMN